MHVVTAPSRSRGWLWLLVVGAVLTQSTVNLLRPVTSYKLLALHADALTIGLCTAAYAVVPLLAAVWLGRTSDRIGQLRWLVAAGAALLVLGGGGLALSGSVPAVAVASAVLGMGHLCFTIGGQASIARYAADRDLDRGFGWFTAAFSAGQMIGPVLGGVLVGTGAVAGSPERLAHIDLAMWVGAGLSLAVVPLMLLPLSARPAARPGTAGPAARPTTTRGGEPGAKGGAAASSADSPEDRGEHSGHDAGASQDRLTQDRAPEARATVFGVLRVPGVASRMLASLSLLAVIDILTAFLPLVGERAGVDAAVIGTLLGVRGLASIASRVLLPWFAARFARTSLLTVCLLGAGLCLLVPPLVVDRVLLAGAFLALGGFLLGLGQPLTMTLITTSVPGTWRGSALAVRLMGNRLGQVLMPLIAGALAAPLGPAGAVWLACGVLLVSGAETAVRARRERS